ncbi:hypothetical protein BFP72_06280 [Reichenbachiella sp. 5M10]|uniref:M28 family metallopeptidase n=1 Tax=Reichenbachiella sp. 5M10 TaxID=1889772 RepID=UPI000C15BB63|nr:M20/M25/M40 family metallo-hydrolase [Reichenbachiella sp. 5M10]PIB35028.1 hypothetical protein BFP72_06280 [Reichenbachiella sp. 5M10]
MLSYQRGAAQDLPYAQAVIKQLASPAFKGRGYVGQGDSIAAAYIREAFDSLGLEPFGKSYLQPFTTSVNTFPSQMVLRINGQNLTPGLDYLIDPGSPSTHGHFETVTLDLHDFIHREHLSDILQSTAGRFQIIPAYNPKDFSSEEQQLIDEVVHFIKYHPDNPAAGSIFLTSQKLTWGGSTRLLAKPSFALTQDSTDIQTLTVEVDNQWYTDYSTQNVIGYTPGHTTDSLVVLTAHYDHLGMMGSETLFPGANDNASGVAMLLNLARHYHDHPPAYTTVFIAFGGEELGLLGSKYFVEHPLFELERIKFLLNFDISGTGDDGIQVVNGSIYREQFDRLSKINQEQDLLTQVKIRGESCNSDHCFFYQQGVPSFFIYTLGGIQAYHDIYDRSETLPLTEFEDYFQLITQFIDGL